MKPQRRPIIVFAAALTLGLAGCGSDGGSDGGSDEGAEAASGGDLCAQLENISNFEMESQSSAAIDPGDWPAMQAILQEYGDGLSEHYDPAIEADDLAADLTTVRDASAQVTELVTESPSFEEYQQQTEASIDVETFTAATDASARIDQYTRANCDFAKQQEPLDAELEELPGQQVPEQPAG